METITGYGTRAADLNGVETAGSADMLARTPTREGLLPEPKVTAPSGDALTMLAQLLTKAARQDRDTARSLEQQEDRTLTQEENASIEEMHAKADDTAASALTAGVGEMVAGAGEVGGGLTTKVDGKLDWNDASAMARAGGSATSKFAKEYDAQGQRHDARAEEHKDHAHAAERRERMAHEGVQDAKDALKKIAEFLKDMQSAQNGARAAAAGYRA